jgi:methionyl-tRNA synthetase
MEQKSQLSGLDIRVGKVISAEDHPDADKLVVLKVDVGEERQIVAGIKKHYPVDQLPGKGLLVVCNLEPAKLRGVESNGMLLAADAGEVVSLLAPPAGAKPGERLDGCEAAPRIDFKKFQGYVLVAGKPSGDKLDIGRPVANETPGVASDAPVPSIVSADMRSATIFSLGGVPATFDRPVAPGAKIR